MGAPQGLRKPDLLFYDGGCGLCHRAVRFLVARDRRGAFRFAPLGGETFLRMVRPDERAGLPDSLVVATSGGGLITRSRAVLHLLRSLGGGWGLVARVAAILPLRWVDGLYEAVARHRGAWFQAPDSACPRLPGDQRARFDP